MTAVPVLAGQALAEGLAVLAVFSMWVNVTQSFSSIAPVLGREASIPS